MADPHDYASLAMVRGYIAPPSASAAGASGLGDYLLGQIITSVSLEMDRYLSRDLMAQTYTEVRNGNGRTSMRTKQYPIIGMTGVSIQGQTVNNVLGNPTQSGFTYDTKFVYLRGSQPQWRGGLLSDTTFGCGVQSVTLGYSAGHLTPGQIALQNLPAWAASTTYNQGAQIMVAGYYYTNIGSKGISGSSTPTFPQSIGAEVADNNVLWECGGPFVAPPTGATMLPQQLKIACCTQAAYEFQWRTRIGDASTGEGPQRVSYMRSDWHPTIISKLNPERLIVPIED